MKCRVRESRLISINEDEGKSTGAGVSAVYQINRGQSRSNQAFGSRPNAWAREVKLVVIQVAAPRAFFGRSFEIKKCCHKNVIVLSESGAAQSRWSRRL